MDVSVTGWKDGGDTARGVKAGPLTRPPHPPPPPNYSVWVMFSAGCRILPGGESRPSEVCTVPLLSKTVLVGFAVTRPTMVSNSADSDA